MSAKPTPLDPYATPTPERMRRVGEEWEEINIDVEQGQHNRTIRLLDDVLEQQRKRDSLSGDQYNAAITFRADWYKSGLSFGGVIDPTREPVDCSPRSDISDDRLDALGRYKDAMKALGPVNALPMVDIVLLNMSLEAHACLRWQYSNMKLARAAGLTGLRIGCSILDVHYYGRRNRSTRTAHVNDYRPPMRKHG